MFGERAILQRGFVDLRLRAENRSKRLLHSLHACRVCSVLGCVVSTAQRPSRLPIIQRRPLVDLAALRNAFLRHGPCNSRKSGDAQRLRRQPQ